MRIDLKRARRGLLRRPQWYATISSNNGRELWRTSETYNNYGDLREQVRLLQELLPEAVVASAP